MLCEVVRSELPALLGRELDGPTTRTMEEHLQVCAGCARARVELEVLEKRLREGLLHAPHTGRQHDVASWLAEHRHRLTPEQAERERLWVADLFGEPCRLPLSRARRRFPGMRALAAGLVLMVVAMANWSALVKASAELPLVGEFVQRLVFTDAGLSWAYEHGYIQKPMADVRAGKVRLKILGAVADPLQTTILYLIDGLQPDPWAVSGVVPAEGFAGWIPPLVITGVNGERVPFWKGQPLVTPLGLVGMVHAEALPSAEAEVTLELRGPAATLEVKLELSRAELSAMSRQYGIEYRHEMEGVLVHEVLVTDTPAQLMVNYVISGGLSPSGIKLEHHVPYLLLPDGSRLNPQHARGRGRQDGSWDMVLAFPRPPDGQVTLVMPVLARNVPVELELAVGNGPFTSSVEGVEFLVEEVVCRDGYLHLSYSWSEGSPGWGLLDWQLVDARGGLLPASSHHTTGSHHDGRVTAGERFELPPGMTITALRATGLQLLVYGNWEIPLR